MLAHGKDTTKNMPPMEFLGNLILLIVGGNDTTRNSIIGRCPLGAQSRMAGLSTNKLQK